MTPVAFQLNLRKQIRKLPKCLKFVKVIQFYSIVSLGAAEGDALEPLALLAHRGRAARRRRTLARRRAVRGGATDHSDIFRSLFRVRMYFCVLLT